MLGIVQVTGATLGAVFSFANPTGAQYMRVDEPVEAPREPLIKSFSASPEHIQWGSQAVRSAWAGLENTIKSWRSLPQGWDGDGGSAPTSRTIFNAILFLKALQSYGAPLPIIGVAGDGEIELKWVKAERFASTSFLSDGHLVAYIEVIGSEVPLEIDAQASEMVWGELLKSIAAFA